MMNTMENTARLSLFAQGVAQYTSVASEFLRVQLPQAGNLLGALVSGTRYWMRRRSIERQLAAMSDYLLEDIGVSRDNLSAFAAECAKCDCPAGIRKQDPTGIKAFAAGVAEAIARRHRRRALKNQLHHMSDRMLMDIGVERADIDAIVQAWNGVETAPAKAKIIGPNSVIGAIVPSEAVSVATAEAANDRDDVRAAG